MARSPAEALTDKLHQALHEFLHSEIVGGVPLIVAAVCALILANTSLAHGYFHLLHLQLGPLGLQHWINDGLMAFFFLMVGLEIKREFIEGEMSDWSKRVLPGAAAVGGMAVPALIYLWFAHGDPEVVSGWAIPAATDIAFALGVLALLGSRVPSSLRVFLTALAIIDDLGAVLIIALFYTANLNFIALGVALLLVAALVALNLSGVRRLAPYLVLGLGLWVAVLMSGVHATLAGVLLALTIPLAAPKGQESPLHRLEHKLNFPVALVVVPVFGFANAGVSFAGVNAALLDAPVFIGIAAGLVGGKLVGVFGTVLLMVKLKLAALPAAASWGQMFGIALLCGIGFTMSLFIGMLAFDKDAAHMDQVKYAILAGSLIAGASGYSVLRLVRGPQKIA